MLSFPLSFPDPERCSECGQVCGWTVAVLLDGDPDTPPRRADCCEECVRAFLEDPAGPHIRNAFHPRASKPPR